jgi:Cys-tRNA(Pro) deacylase
MHNLNNLPSGVQSTLACIKGFDIPYDLRAFTKPAHTANQAAALLACPLGAIVKSLVFLMGEKEALLLVLVSGKNRADLNRLREILGQPVQPAKPEVVKKLTGYEVGAVPPVGMAGDYPVIMDEDLLAFDQVWASAGAGTILIGLSPQDLQQVSRAEIRSVK